ncbi:hypothetical protein BE18_07305 [Sorangium cellulosum]|uniref:PE-PGRS family protein n=1 Tax=Sorangium cellulosum TaxID=56 RepID=A0A150SQE3_SORCE|nr:hypothetical protein BE18_07305 [Sorangium cellulosum]
MGKTTATAFFLLLSPWATGCGTAPGINGAGGAPCDGLSCQDEPPPESVCIEHVAAHTLDDGCGVFVAGALGGGDDRNPGTKAKPVFTVHRAVELARAGRGRVFICNDGFEVKTHITLPSGVDLLGGYDCRRWVRDPEDTVSTFVHTMDTDPLVIIEPSGSEDRAAADGVSILADLDMRARGPVAVLVQSNTEVEILRSQLRAGDGWAGRPGKPWSGLNQAAAGADGLYGGDACSATIVHGGPAVVNPCEGGIPSTGGKGGDGLSDGAGNGDDGQPITSSHPNEGRGGDGNGEATGIHCYNGGPGAPGALGTIGASGQGIGHITETGWVADRAGDGGRGMPGQGGGGGGGRRGGLAVCGVATKGGAGGGSGGAGGCGGRGGQGGENGYPTIGIVALHAKVTVRDSMITTLRAGPGGDGGLPEEGGDGGRGAPGGALGDGTWSCGGGSGGRGGDGGYGGPGRGGDSIGIAYLDEDQLTLEGVTYELGPPGKGGVSWDWSGVEIRGEDGIAVKTLRFPQ